MLDNIYSVSKLTVNEKFEILYSETVDISNVKPSRTFSYLDSCVLMGPFQDLFPHSDGVHPNRSSKIDEFFTLQIFILFSSCEQYEEGWA